MFTCLVMIDRPIAGIDHKLEQRVWVRLTGASFHLDWKKGDRKQQEGAYYRERPRVNRVGGSGSDALATTSAKWHQFTGAAASALPSMLPLLLILPPRPAKPLYHGRHERCERHEQQPAWP